MRYLARTWFFDWYLRLARWFEPMFKMWSYKELRKYIVQWSCSISACFGAGGGGSWAGCLLPQTCKGAPGPLTQRPSLDQVAPESFPGGEGRWSWVQNRLADFIRSRLLVAGFKHKQVYSRDHVPMSLWRSGDVLWFGWDGVLLIRNKFGGFS